jgi:hypothetical protein
MEMGSSTNRWSREELEDAWARYQEKVVEVGKTWDWASYANIFTEDATYHEHALGDMTGRDAIRNWIVNQMNIFPGSEMPVYPVPWYSIDVEKGWVIFKNVNTMKDPGDGSVHGAEVITVLHYAGDDKWSYEEDAYNPMNFLMMVQGYIQRCHELGTISDDAKTFAKNMSWELT